MPFPFQLPTTSSVLLSDFFNSATHPSLPLVATTKRSVVKDALKKHKRLHPRDQAAHLPAIQNALTSYIPYVLALNRAASFQDVGRESIDLEIKQPLQVEWRTTLTATLPGREPARPLVLGLHNEIAFVISTLAQVYTLMARAQLWTVANSTVTTLSTEQRTQALTAAMKHLLEAHAIHSFLIPTATSDDSTPLDIRPNMLQALAALSLAEANLTFLSKDDPYLSAIASDRNASNKEWIYVPQSIPKVRAHLYARIALASHEHATESSSLFSGTSKISPDLIKYATNLTHLSRARACRFLAIDTELSSQTGTALAWLNAAKHLLGSTTPSSSSSSNPSQSSPTTSKLQSLKNALREKREDHHIKKTSSDNNSWGLDAGKAEEMRVIDALYAKWDRENSTYNVQAIPPWEPLLSGQMPSGRNSWNDLKAWEPPELTPGEWEAMRAPLGPEEKVFRGEEEDSGDEGRGARLAKAPAGAFPGSKEEYGGKSGSGSTYY